MVRAGYNALSDSHILPQARMQGHLEQPLSAGPSAVGTPYNFQFPPSTDWGHPLRDSAQHTPYLPRPSSQYDPSLLAPQNAYNVAASHVSVTDRTYDGRPLHSYPTNRSHVRTVPSHSSTSNHHTSSFLSATPRPYDELFGHQATPGTSYSSPPGYSSFGSHMSQAHDTSAPSHVPDMAPDYRQHPPLPPTQLLAPPTHSNPWQERFSSHPQMPQQMQHQAPTLQRLPTAPSAQRSSPMQHHPPASFPMLQQPQWQSLVQQPPPPPPPIQQQLATSTLQQPPTTPLVQQPPMLQRPSPLSLTQHHPPASSPMPKRLLPQPQMQQAQLQPPLVQQPQVTSISQSSPSPPAPAQPSALKRPSPPPGAQQHPPVSSRMPQHLPLQPQMQQPQLQPQPQSPPPSPQVVQHEQPPAPRERQQPVIPPVRRLSGAAIAPPASEIPTPLLHSSVCVRTSSIRSTLLQDNTETPPPRGQSVEGTPLRPQPAMRLSQCEPARALSPRQIDGEEVPEVNMDVDKVFSSSFLPVVY